MKVNLPDGSTATVLWKYDTVDVLTKQEVKLGETDATTCTVRIFTRDGRLLVEASETIKRYKYDIFDKDIARKESLKKVLDTLYPLRKLSYYGEPFSSQIEELTKKVKEYNTPIKMMRSLFWDAYLTRNDNFLKKSKLGLPV